MLKKGKTHEIYLTKEMAEQMTEVTGIVHKGGEKLFLCKIDEKFYCPYRKNTIFHYCDSEKDKDFGSKKIEFYVCGIISDLEKL